MTVLFPVDLTTDEDDIIRKKIDRFTQVFTRVNSVLTLRPVRVKTEHSHRSAPAWSTADTVTFNSRLIGELREPKDIAMIRGLDLHEVAHILYTPRTGSEIWQWVEDKGYFNVFNLLEDQRIETLLVGRYPSVAAWLRATMAKFLIETEYFDTSYPLLRGRRYLPVEIRKASRQAYKHQEKVNDIARVIDDYRTVVFPRDTERAKELIAEMSDLLTEQPEEGTGDEGGCGGTVIIVPNPFGHGDRPAEGMPSSTSRPASEREQDADRSRPEAGEDDLDENLDEGTSERSEEGEGDEGTGAGNSSATDPSTASEESSPSSQAGNSGDQIFRDMLKDLLDEVLEQQSEQIEDIVRQIAGLPSLQSTNASEPKRSRQDNREVAPATLAAARDFGRELLRLRTAHDPSWLRGVDSGRLIPLRAGRGDDPETVFDRFSRGREDATDIECVILLDVSGSMGGRKGEEAYQAMYAIKRAMDKIEASTTVVTFASSASTLYRADEKADLHVRYGGIGGGTDPMDAVRYATRVLAETERAIRLFIVITDGEWYQAEEADNLIRKMRLAGVLTSFAYISHYGEKPESRHNCETFTTVTNVPDIINIARDVVRVGIARQLINR